MRSNNKKYKLKKNVTIIGGGIIGLATACSLVQKNFNVTIIDETGLKNRASSATAGIIGGSSVIPWANDDLWGKIPSMDRNPNGPLKINWPLPKDSLSFLYKSWRAGSVFQSKISARGLAQLGLRGWSSWQNLLKGFAKSKNFFSQNGCLLYYSNQEEFHHESGNNKIRRRLGMKIKDLRTSALLSKIPSTSDEKPMASLIKKAGHLSNPVKLQKSLINEILRKGAKQISAKVNDFNIKDNKITSVSTNKGQIESDIVIICAGYGSKILANILGSSVSMLPAWGSSIVLHNINIKINLPILIEKKGFAIVPNSKDLRIAGLVQIGGGNYVKNKNFEKILLNQTKKIFGNFKYTKISSETGPRPLTPDSLPVICKSPNFPNAYFNFGHGHWGMTHAPVSAKIITDLLFKKKPEIDIKPYDVLRFN